MTLHSLNVNDLHGLKHNRLLSLKDEPFFETDNQTNMGICLKSIITGPHAIQLRG
jgi:hypothetical protein